MDADAAPVFLWLVTPAGTVTDHSPGAPGLPAGLLAAHPPHDGLAFTAGLGRTGAFRLRLARDGGDWLIAGQSRAGDAHTARLLLYAEVIAGPVLLLAMFFGSLVVGLRALAPVEQSRRRQLEFTADASHELRTPLSVIRAEADVALSSPRDAAQYRDALTRIQGESGRLRQLVDDMLWLARFDSRPPPPGDEPVDLVTLAQACADRFRAVGPAVTADTGAEPALISAPPDWIDRLAGVLMDNACRYAGPAGQVRIGVRTQGNRVSLTVEDSGPGIPEAERSRLFDRFHRVTEHRPGPGRGASPNPGPNASPAPAPTPAPAPAPTPAEAPAPTRPRPQRQPQRRPRCRPRRRPQRRPRPGHRRLDRPLHRRPLAGRRLPPGRRPDDRLLETHPAPPPLHPPLHPHHRVHLTRPHHRGSLLMP